jgi:hypothetical protein
MCLAGVTIALYFETFACLLDDTNIAQVVLNTLFASHALSPQFLSKRKTTE